MGAVTGGFERAFVIGAALVLASCGDGGALD